MGKRKFPQTIYAKTDVMAMPESCIQCDYCLVAYDIGLAMPRCRAVSLCGGDKFGRPIDPDAAGNGRQAWCPLLEAPVKLDNGRYYMPSDPNALEVR